MIIDILKPNLVNYGEPYEPDPPEQQLVFECAQCSECWNPVIGEDGLLDSNCPKGCYSDILLYWDKCFKWR